MTIKQICNVKDNRLIINLPKSFKDGGRVMVIVDDEPDARDEKMALMQNAAIDPMYLADMAEVEEDIDFADSDSVRNVHRIIS